MRKGFGMQAFSGGPEATDIVIRAHGVVEYSC
jgi:hypothetical protein